ncbi:MAG: SPOR domain-containing protein [Rhodobacter sp.]|nr:SPOR domain-containing protein [Paracoccaceae bacterium]MCC0077738.1 SPOR domain-containing protein [Rhodobacter sp.]
MDRAGSTAFPRLAPFSRLAVTLAAGLALGGCVTTTDPAASPGVEAVQPAAAGPSQRVIERDVEAPEVFQVEESGLWDGRPSLGGVWVAHPTARDPERVLIRNDATGQTVIGALFRRERENPGPRFQISSEAANALGILPGAPTEISVTALRLQRVEMEIDPEPEAPVTAATETLAIAPVQTAEAPAAAATPAGAPEGQVEIADTEPQRRSLRDLFRRRPPEPEAEIAATTLDPVAPVAETVTATAAAAATATETATAAVEPAEPVRERRSLRDLFRRHEPEPEPDTTMIALPDAPAAAPLAAAAPAQPQAPRIDRPFVQIGIFSVEQNAVNARNQMQAAGLLAEIRRGRVGDNLFWRVVVGPAQSTSERASLITRVRSLGFADAYAVVR